MAKTITTANVKPAYWDRYTDRANMPRLRRACQWSDSTQWHDQYSKTEFLMRALRSPLLIIPEDTHEFTDIPENNWLSVEAEAFCTRWTTEQIDRIMLDIARSTELLNSAELLAANLCPANVLIDDSDDEPRAALSDFSSCIPLDLPADNWRAFLHMPEYAAPEIRTQNMNGALSKLQLSADVFSLGLLYHIYLTGRIPQFSRTVTCGEEDMIPAGDAKLSRTRKLDQTHRKLIYQMLEIDPAKRIDSAALVARKIDQTLRFGYCEIELTWPGHEDEPLTLSSSGGFRSRQRIKRNGAVRFGPLLSSETYSLSKEGRFIADITFPSYKSGQSLSISVQKLLEPAQARPVSVPRMCVITLDKPINHICRIEILSERYCRLTLINGGTLRIRRMDAARFGIEELLKSKVG